jgi:hypothetical protein
MLSEEDKQTVRERAQFRCEYCHAPEAVAGYAFHLEHITPRRAKGKDTLENIALSCVQCNRAKWHYTAGIDPQTGAKVLLFNRRMDTWSNHFEIQRRIYIRGTTPVGRATETQLKMNNFRQIEARRFWVKIGVFP